MNRNRISLLIICIFFYLGEITKAYTQERPIVEWQVIKTEIGNNEILLNFSFATEPGWSIYAINPDTTKFKITATMDFIKNENITKIGELTSSEAKTVYDKDLGINVSYFLEKGTFIQKIKKNNPCTVDFKIKYTMVKKTSTVVGEGAMLFRGDESFQVQLK